MRIDGQVAYEARALGPMPWRIAWSLLWLVAVIPPFVVDPYPKLSENLAMIPIYAISWGLPVWIGLLTLWSINRYADITVTDQVLRVGREVLPLEKIDPRQVRAKLATLTTPVAGPRTGPPARSEDLEPARVRHMGGAYASTFGSTSVVVAQRDRQGLGIDARDPVAFLTALASVLPES